MADLQSRAYRSCRRFSASWATDRDSVPVFAERPVHQGVPVPVQVPVETPGGVLHFLVCRRSPDSQEMVQLPCPGDPRALLRVPQVAIQQLHRRERAAGDFREVR